LLSELQNLQQPTLLVSHLPFIPALVSLLTGKPITIEFESIPAGTLIALQRESSGWHITSILTA
jgi:phosphohistidine phosphatase SixA